MPFSEPRETALGPPGIRSCGGRGRRDRKASGLLPALVRNAIRPNPPGCAWRVIIDAAHNANKVMPICFSVATHSTLYLDLTAGSVNARAQQPPHHHIGALLDVGRTAQEVNALLSMTTGAMPPRLLLQRHVLPQVVEDWLL